MKNKNSIEVECPQCGAKSMRFKAVLKICVTGCPERRCMWKHELMVAKEHREKQLKKLN